MIPTPEHLALLESVLGQVPASVAVFRGPELIIEFANARFANTFGHRPLLGRPLREAVPELGRQGLLALIERVASTGEPYLGHAVPIRVDGPRGPGLPEMAYLEVSFQPLRGPAGVEGVVSFSYSVTELVRARTQAEEATRLREEFLSVASHELRTPLTPMLINLQLLLRDLQRQSGQTFPVARVLELVQGLHRQARRLSALVEDLLDVTRIRSGQLDLQPAPCDLAAVAREGVENFGPHAAQAGSALTLQALAPVGGNWDRKRLEQVVTNLLSNALKYGAGHPVEVRVSCTDAEARLEVEDHGIGIADGEQERIFGRFERAGPNLEVSGLGLGLYIARQVVEAHGGRITVRSQPGQGATFSATLPRPGTPA